MKRNILVIGASAGGIAAVPKVISGLRKLPISIFVTVHTTPESPRLFAKILERSGHYDACYPEDGQKLEQGKIYVAPPDHHLLLRQRIIRVSRGPKENLHRPAIDPMFRSAAASFGKQVIGVVLTGLLADGTSGLSAIKTCGGTTVVQEPKDAQFPGMPRNALKRVSIDHCVPVSEMAALLNTLLKTEVESPAKPNGECKSVQIEAEIAEGKRGTVETIDGLGARSSFSCPECNGVLWEMKDGRLVRFRCHIGHAYSAESLDQHEIETIDRALSIALRALEDSAALTLRLARRAHEDKDEFSRQLYESRSKAATRSAALIREMILKNGSTPRNSRKH